MNWLLELLVKKLDFLPYKKRIIAGGTAFVISGLDYGLAHLPAGLVIPPAPMHEIQVSLEWGFTAAAAIFVWGILCAAKRGATVERGDATVSGMLLALMFSAMLWGVLVVLMALASACGTDQSTQLTVGVDQQQIQNGGSSSSEPTNPCETCQGTLAEVTDCLDGFGMELEDCES